MPLLPSFWAALVVGVVASAVLPARWRSWAVAGISVCFLLVVAPWTAVGLLGFGLAYRALLADRPSRGLVLALVVAALAPLAVCKYLPPVFEGVAMPLGISYFSFKLVHYALDRGEGTLEHSSLGDWLAWLFLFPIYTAGPIERFDHFTRSSGVGWRPRDLVAGGHRIAHGLVKKFVLAEHLLGQVATVTPEEVVAGSATRLEVWAFLGATFLYNYLDFSAYSDLAVGGSRVLGIRVMENFNWPIAAGNIGDFWKRWHISLTSWCQRYVYMPAFARTRSPYLSVFATFSAMGLWHSGSLAWLCWGLWHALGVSVYLTWRRRRRLLGIRARGGVVSRVAAHALTLAFVSAGYAFTAIDGTPLDSLRILGGLVGFGTWGVTHA